MVNEKLPNRRDILKIGAGMVAGAAGLKIAERIAEKEQGGDLPYIMPEPPRVGEPQQRGEPHQIVVPPEIAYDPISEITYFETNGRIEEVLSANRTQIIFDKKTGNLRVLNETGQELTTLPGTREILAVFVSAERTSLKFEYRDQNGSNFGVIVGRSIEDGQFVITPWNADLLAPPDVPKK